jgi:hypothetical protein
MDFWRLLTGNMPNSWDKFCRLTLRERWLLFQAFLFLPIVAVGLHTMNFQRVHALLMRFSSPPVDANRDDAEPQAKVIARLIQAAACRIPFRITCLVRSTTLWWFLRRQGIASEIRIGVNKEQDGFQAHAWVEMNGMVLNDRDDIGNQYAAFDGVTLRGSTERP